MAPLGKALNLRAWWCDGISLSLPFWCVDVFQSGKWKKSWRKGCLEECATIAYVLSWTYSLPPKNKKICKSASHNYSKEELGVGFYSSTFLSSSSFLYLVNNYYSQCGLLFCCPHSSVESFNHYGWSLAGAKYDSVLPNIITFRYFLYLFYGHWHRDLSVTFGFWPLTILEGGNLWLSCLPMQAAWPQQEIIKPTNKEIQRQTNLERQTAPRLF